VSGLPHHPIGLAPVFCHGLLTGANDVPWAVMVPTFMFEGSERNGLVFAYAHDVQ
jgi:hypothetical protein